MSTEKYFATCARGVEAVLAGELRGLGAADVEPGRGGVHFAGDLALLYRANLWLRTAIRVLRPILEATVTSPDELYDAVRSLDWSRYMTPDHTLAVDCNVRDSHITHSKYAALRTKDAICDQFVEKCGRRPSVNVDEPMVGLNLHVYRDRAVLSLESSGESLHKRGYRPVLTRAPLNEALAAALVLMTGWKPDTPFCDPMCGSGVLPIEAAWIALRRPPGLTRKRFGFQGWMDYDVRLWTELRDEARRGVGRALPAPILGADVRGDAGVVRHQQRPRGRHRPFAAVREARRARLPAAGGAAGRDPLQPALRRTHRRGKRADTALPGAGGGVRAAVSGLDGVRVHGQPDAGGRDRAAAGEANTAL